MTKQVSIDIVAEDNTSRVLREIADNTAALRKHLLDTQSQIKKTGSSVKSKSGILGSLSKKMNEVTRSFAGFTIGGFKSIVSGVVNSAVNTLKWSLVGLTTTVGAFLVNGVRFAANIESQRAGFKTLLGSMEAADKAIEMIKKDAAATPFDLPQLITGNKRLVTFTKDAVVAEELLLNLGKSVSAAGMGNVELDRATMSLMKMSAAGKITATDYIELANAGIDIKNLLADNLGITTAEVMKLHDQGKITFKDITEAINAAGNEGGKFANAFIDQAGTFNQLASNMGDVLGILGGEIVEKSGMFDMLKNAMSNGISVIEKNKDAIIEFSSVLIGKVGDGINYVIEKLKAWWKEMGGIEGAKKKIEEFGTIMKDYILPAIESVFDKVVELVEKTIEYKELITAFVFTLASLYTATIVYNAAMATKNTLTGIYNGLITLAKSQTLAFAMANMRVGIAMGISTAITYAKNIALFTYNVVVTISTALTWAFGAAIAFLTAPITLVILAVGALIAAIVWFFTQTELGQYIVASAWETIKILTGLLITTMQGYFLAFKVFFTVTLAEIWAKFMEIWNGIIAFYVKAGELIVKTTISVWESAKQTIINAVAVIREWVMQKFEEIAGWIQQKMDWAAKQVDKAASVMGSAIQGVGSFFDGLSSTATSAINSIISIWNKAKSLISKGIEGVIKIFTKQSGSSKKALGGNVTAGKSYTVGERGPETFVPNESGTIVPTQRTGGGATYTFNFQGAYIGDKQAFINEIQRAIGRNDELAAKGLL